VGPCSACLCCGARVCAPCATSVVWPTCLCLLATRVCTLRHAFAPGWAAACVSVTQALGAPEEDTEAEGDDVAAAEQRQQRDRKLDSYVALLEHAVQCGADPALPRCTAQRCAPMKVRGGRLGLPACCGV
jgi:hypothetical protein